MVATRPAGRVEHIARFILAKLASDPPTPGGGEIVAAFSFDASTPSQVLGALSSGAVVNRVALLVETPFNDPAATFSLGTSSSPSLFFTPSDARLATADQYQSDALVVVPTNDVILFTANFGAATLGAGILFYKALP